MKIRNLQQILVLVLAVAISIYFWLGDYAVIVYVVAVLFGVIVYLWLRKGRTKAVENRPKENTKVVATELQAQIVQRRREQGLLLLSVSEQIKALKPESSRLIERLLDWYLDYLRDNGIYHQDLYQHLLTRIKERQKQAKAHYLKRELEQSKIIVRAIMRGDDAEKIVERLETEKDVDSQE